MVPSMSMMIGAAVASSMMMASCLISAVQLARHRKETPDYTRVFLFFCAVFFVAEGTFSVVGIIQNPYNNPLTELMNPSVVLFGLLAQILALVYPLCVVRPSYFNPFIFMFVPWAIFVFLYILVPEWTVLRSFQDFKDHLLEINVHLRLVTLCMYLPYLIYLLFLLMPGSLNQVSVSVRYYRGYSIFVLFIVAAHFFFFFTGNLFYHILNQLAIGAFFYIIMLFDLEVRLFPKDDARQPDVLMPALGDEVKKREYISRPLWERICYALDKEEVWRRPDLSVESLARTCGSNVPYIIKCIKKETGYSANEYINRMRIDHVCRRLEEDPDLNLQEVFFEAGYRVRTTAWRNFRDIVGVSPSEYRFSKR